MEQDATRESDLQCVPIAGLGGRGRKMNNRVNGCRNRYLHSIVMSGLMQQMPEGRNPNPVHQTELNSKD